MTLLPAFLLAIGLAAVSGQRITTIQLDGVSYFISRMNPYSPELNYFLAYQYCRSIGLQLASFETKEKADSITQYLINAGYSKYDFWTSGNRLGTDMMIWMSTGLPFNATFDYMRKAPGEESLPVARQLGAVEQRKDSGSADGCVALRAPDLVWDTDDCTAIKDFICEQTRCYYYNYGSIPVSAAQGSKRMRSSTRTPTSTAPSAKYITNDSTVTNASDSTASSTNSDSTVSSTTSDSTVSSTTSDSTYSSTTSDSTYSSTTTDPSYSNTTSETTYSSTSSDSTYSSTTSDSTYSSTTSDSTYNSTTSDPAYSSTTSDLTYSSTTSDSSYNSTTDIFNNTSTESGSSISTESSTLEYSSTDLPPCDPDPVSNGNPKSRSTVSRSNTASQPDTEETIPWSWARNIMLEKPVLKKSASL